MKNTLLLFLFWRIGGQGCSVDSDMLLKKVFATYDFEGKVIA